MKMVVLYRNKSDHARTVESFLHNYESRTGLSIKRLEIDSLEGSEFAKLYGITRYPAIIATKEDGSLHTLWADEQLPQIQDVEHIARQ